MGIFDSAIRAAAHSNLTFPKQWLVDFFGGGGESESGLMVNSDTMMSESAVWCAVNFLAGNIASLPCPVLKVEGRQRNKQKGHCLHQRLNVMANPYMTAMTWRETCIYYQAFWGTSLSIISRNRTGGVAALWPVHPDRLMEIKRVGDRLKYRILLDNGKEKVFNQADVLRIPGMGNGLMGLSMLESSKNSIGLILAMRSFANLFFKNGSNMGVIFEHPGQLGEKAHQNLTKSLSMAYSGLGKSHKAMVAEEGMKVQKTGVDPEKSQLLEARQFAITDVARWFNLPPHVLKDLSHSNYSNMQQQSLELITYSFRPWFVKLEQSYEAFLLRDFEKGVLSVRHNANALMRGDEQSRGEYYRMRFGTGSITPNEIRQLEDENPIEEPWADKTYMQLNLVPSDTLSELQQKQLDRQYQSEKEKAGVDRDDFFFTQSRGREPLTKEEEHIRGIQALQNRYHKKLADAAGVMVARECKAVRKGIKSNFKSRSNKDFLKWLEEFYKKLPESIKSDFGPVLTEYSRLIARESGRMIGMESVVTDELMKFITEYLDVYAVRHCGSSLGQLKKLIEDSSNPDEVEQVLIQRVSEWQETRSGKIADDETIRAANAVTREAWRQQGVVKLKWVTQGSKSCPFCKQLNGKIVGITSPFLGKGDILTGKDSNGNYMKIKGRKHHPPIHKGCVCAIVPVDAGNRLLGDPYTEAQAKDGTHHNWMKQQQDKTLKQLKKSERSALKRVKEHIDKIKNPEKFYPDFYTLHEKRQTSLLEYIWPSDILRNSQQLSIIRAVIKEKRGS